MEIKVKGQGEKRFKPDQIGFDVNISNVYSNYEEALAKGEESVLEFLNEMKAFGFDFEDFKTVNYQIRDEMVYKNNVYTKVGVRYTRGLNLKFDYDIAKMAKMVEVASKMENAPRINVRYGLKDVKTAEMELFADAYQNAKRQADLIAQAAGLKVVRCEKVNIDEDYGDYYSNTCYDGAMMSKSSSSAGENMAKTYTPDDICVEKEIFCVFIAE